GAGRLDRLAWGVVRAAAEHHAGHHVVGPHGRVFAFDVVVAVKSHAFKGFAVARRTMILLLHETATQDPRIFTLARGFLRFVAGLHPIADFRVPFADQRFERLVAFARRAELHGLLHRRLLFRRHLELLLGFVRGGVETGPHQNRDPCL